MTYYRITVTNVSRNMNFTLNEIKEYEYFNDRFKAEAFRESWLKFIGERNDTTRTRRISKVEEVEI